MINLSQRLLSNNLEVADAKTHDTASPRSTDVASGEDTVALSTTALSSAQGFETREQKVHRLRSEIENGTYVIAPRSVAQAILHRTLKEVEA